MFPIGDNEELPFEFIHPNHCWFHSETNDEKNQEQDDDKIDVQVYKDELADEKVLWINYSDATREVWLNDCYGQIKLLSRPQFGGVNDNFFAFLYGNAQHKLTSSDLLNRGVDLNNKSLHKAIGELGFRGKLKRLFFKVSKSTVVFNSSVTRKGLKEANIPDSKEELYQLFFTQ